jgi:hypothetical protein
MAETWSGNSLTSTISWIKHELEDVMELSRCIETCREQSNRRTPLLSTHSKDFWIYCCISEAEHSDTSLQDGDSDILELHEILKLFM